MLNEAASLFELEEDGYFKFYSSDELVNMLKTAGFKNIKTTMSLGSPPLKPSSPLRKNRDNFFYYWQLQFTSLFLVLIFFRYWDRVLRFFHNQANQHHRKYNHHEYQMLDIENILMV